MRVLIEEHGECVVRCARPWHLALAVLCGFRLDGDLVAGRAPEESVLLAVRATRICRPGYQRDLGRNLARIVATRRFLPESVATLSDALLGGGLVPARAVALAGNLLADGAGPLYRPGGGREVDAAIRRALGEATSAAWW